MSLIRYFIILLSVRCLFVDNIIEIGCSRPEIFVAFEQSFFRKFHFTFRALSRPIIVVEMYKLFYGNVVFIVYEIT